MKVFLVSMFVILLAGCATSEAVYLQNSTGQTVQCGPYTVGGSIPQANVRVQERLRDCVADYQRQGYERTPGKE